VLPILCGVRSPFRGIPDKREVWAWGMYDLANQSFTLLITTLFFAVYFTERVVPDREAGTRLWGLSFAIASGIVVVISPLLGALADFSGLKKRFLITLGALCILFTASLALVGPGDVALAMTLYIAANVCFMAGENFLGAFLPEIATRDTIGRISAIGWTMGYIGALLCLPLSLLIPGVIARTNAGFQGVFLFAALWFLVNAAPTALFLRERKAPEPLPAGQTLLTVGFSRLAESARHIGRFRQLALFLLIFLVYSCGVQIIVVFSGAIAHRYLDDQRQLVLFIWVLAAVAGAASFLTGLFQDRIGHKATILVALSAWIATGLGAAALPASGAVPQPWHIWCVGIGVGIGLGLIGSSSRALVGAMTPAHKTAEFFGLWGLAYKGAGVLGPSAFGLLAAELGQRAGMLLVSAFFLAGFFAMFAVHPEQGRRAAEEAERDAAAQTDIRDVAAAARYAPRTDLPSVLEAEQSRTGRSDAGRTSG